jgi:hypothetical protein
MTKIFFRILKKFITYIIQFNILIAIKLIIIPCFQRNIPPYERFAYKHNAIKKYLKRRYFKIINSFKWKQNMVNSSLAGDYPIWFLWWQGEDLMPPIVRVCYQMLIKHSNGHKVFLITKANFKDFVMVPDYILKKADKNIISLTHLSDIIRICLLYEHGGLWVDATVLLTEPLPPLPLICTHLGFWTPKDNCAVLNSYSSASNWIIREDKWLSFCLYFSKKNLLAGFVRALFFEYTKKEKGFIDYFLFDYFISLCYESIPDMRVMIDSVPQNNPRIHDIQHQLKLNYEYNKTLFDEVCSDTFFHKLSWKEDFKEYTENGKLTNYGHIINNFPGI